jgi:large subunit ribosomal protein L28e
MVSSSQLNWQIIRNHSSFLVKRNGVQMSREAGNLTAQNSYKFSGIANDRAVSVDASAEGFALTLKSTGARASKPAKTVQKANLGRNVRRPARNIKGALAQYRPDLASAAQARLYRLNQVKKNAGKKYNLRAHKRASK